MLPFFISSKIPEFIYRVEPVTFDWVKKGKEVKDVAGLSDRTKRV